MAEIAEISKKTNAQPSIVTKEQKKPKMSLELDDTASKSSGPSSRASTASRGSFKPNLQILLPEDEPGTDYNPNFKTPPDAYKGAVRPVFS